MIKPDAVNETALVTGVHVCMCVYCIV